MHDLAHLGPQLFNGIVLGAFYAIVALGLSLIMNLTGTINMAHGSFMTLAGYLAFTMVSRGAPFWFALLAAPASDAGGENGTPLGPQMRRNASSAMSERPNVISRL